MIWVKCRHFVFPLSVFPCPILNFGFVAGIRRLPPQTSCPTIQNTDVIFYWEFSIICLWNYLYSPDNFIICIFSPRLLAYSGFLFPLESVLYNFPLFRKHLFCLCLKIHPYKAFLLTPPRTDIFNLFVFPWPDLLRGRQGALRLVI